jgi:hypothetical protein
MNLQNGNLVPVAQHPRLFGGSGFLCTLINRLFMAVFRDLLLRLFCNTLFSILTLIYFYLIVEKSLRLALTF